VGIKQVSNVKQMLGKLTTLDSNNYPEMLGKTCIINAPPGFNMMFGMIKPFLDVRTRAKVEVSRACLWWRLLCSSSAGIVNAGNFEAILGVTSQLTMRPSHTTLQSRKQWWTFLTSSVAAFML